MTQINLVESLRLLCCFRLVYIKHQNHFLSAHFRTGAVRVREGQLAGMQKDHLGTKKESGELNEILSSGEIGLKVPLPGSGERTRISVSKVRQSVARHIHSLRRDKAPSMSVHIFMCWPRDTTGKWCGPYTSWWETNSEKRGCARQDAVHREREWVGRKTHNPACPGSNMDSR